jgi:Protein of unknown function (DUF4229)
VDISGSTSRADGDPAGREPANREPPNGELAEEAASGGLSSTAEPTTAGAGAAQLAKHLAIYTILRLVLVVLLTAALAFFMPLIVAVLFAIIVQLPLSWLLFSGPRRRVNEAIALSTARRRSERARLQSALSGDEPIG